MSFERSHAKHAVLLLGAATFALAGCNTVHKHIGEEDPAFGEAVKYDTALQTVNPDPVYPANAAQPGASGDKGAHAVKRYRTDAVKAVESEQTTAGSTGSSSMSH
jgi:predicted small secreted protein